MKRTLVILVATLCVQNGAFGQTSGVTGTELWTGPSIGVKLNRKWQIQVAEQFRFEDSFSTMKSFTQVGFKRKLNKRLGLRFSYRHTLVPNARSRKRLMVDLLYNSKKKNDLRYGFRLRVQNSMKSFTGKQSSYIRAKAKLGYNLSKLVDPFIAGETFFRVISNNEYRGWRATAGLDWRLTKTLDLTTYARIDREVNVAEPSKTLIYGLLLDYTPKKKKKK